ncbi:unnamed protein product [Moneuplotes crassus]|uniref:Uncharacterized protein n=1 Tax=Euplotes crassus TaxID=5936 RepID=A0AAD1URY8_EUPCR|nr:unnamed protein product [Moneuplotes crassus]
MESVITQEKYITEQEEQVSTAVKTFIDHTMYKDNRGSLRNNTTFRFEFGCSNCVKILKTLNKCCRIRSGFLELTELSKLHCTIRFLEHVKNLILDLKCLNGASKITRLSVFQTAKFIQINNFAWEFKDFLKIICCASLARSITFNKID